MPNTAAQLIAQGESYLTKKYPGYFALPSRERAVLAAAWLNDVVKPREKTGNNDGDAVEAIQKAGGGTKGLSWCAFAQNVVALVSRTWQPVRAVGRVLSWLEEAKRDNRLVTVKEAVRGDILIRNPGDGTHHIGRLVLRVLGLVYSIEGNTSPGDQGSQSNGQGMYRRVRPVSFWHNAVRCD